MKRTHSSDPVRALLEQRNHFLAFVQRRVRSRAAAEDILQSAYLRVVERPQALRQKASVVAWFYRILRNSIIDHYRRQAASERMLAAWTREVEMGVKPDIQTHERICRCLMDLVRGLRPEYRQALQMVDLDGESLKTLGQRARITAGNAAVRVHRARRAFKKLLLACCGYSAKRGCVNCDC